MGMSNFSIQLGSEGALHTNKKTKTLLSLVQLDIVEKHCDHQ